MYHQFKELADIDITKKPMEIGPTTHYIMGGVRVDGDTQMSTVPGLFAAGECAAGINGANRLGGNSLSDIVVFGKRAGEYAAQYARDSKVGGVNPDQLRDLEREILAPFERPATAESPFQLQYELQENMQDLAGIVRTESEMLQTLEKLQQFKQRSAKVAAIGNRWYNPGWHTALDLHNLLT